MYGEVVVNYIEKLQKVTQLKGYTITPSGKKIVAKRISDYMPHNSMDLYGGMSMKVLSMSGLEKGCEIEYSYKMKSNDLGTYYIFDEFHMLTETAPVKYGRFSVKLPYDIELYYASNNVPSEPTIESKGTKRTYIWEAEDLECIKYEECMPPIKGFSAWISVSTSNSWDDFIDSWHDIYRLKAAVSPRIKALIKDLVKDETDKRKMAEAIFKYVQNKIRYLAIEFGRAGWVPDTADKVLRGKAGDCKGKTVLTIAMLKAVGIKAYPAMLNSRSKGPTIKEICDDSQFSHVLPVCEINSKLVWMDPTEKESFGSLPYYYQGVEAFLIKRDGDGFYTTPISETADNINNSIVTLELKDDGSAISKISILGTGLYAMMYRQRLQSLAPELRDQYFKTMASDMAPTATIERYTYSDYTDSAKPMKVDMDVIIKKCADRAGDLLIIDSVAGRVGRKSFINDTRFYDMELGAKNHSSEEERIIIPRGFAVDVLPENYSRETEYLSVNTTYSTRSGMIIRKTVSEWRNLSIPKSEYNNVREILDEFYLNRSKKIILKRI